MLIIIFKGNIKTFWIHIRRNGIFFFFVFNFSFHFFSFFPTAFSVYDIFKFYSSLIFLIGRIKGFTCAMQIRAQDSHKQKAHTGANTCTSPLCLVVHKPAESDPIAPQAAKKRVPMKKAADIVFIFQIVDNNNLLFLLMIREYFFFQR